MEETYAQLIDQYLRGRLTAKEQEDWERYFPDPTFQRELVFRQQLQKAAQIVGREQLKKRLQTLETQYVSKPARPQVVRQWWVWSSVAALALIGLWGIYLLTVQPNFTEQLVTQYLEPYPNIVAPLQRGQQNTLFHQRAFQQYEQGAYQAASKLFENLPARPERDFYLAQSYLMTNTPSAAMPLLRVLSQGNSRFQQPAQWYEALCYLALNNSQKAISSLKQISTTTNHPYQNKAHELLQKLQQS